jgi:hypothetical protein
MSHSIVHCLPLPVSLPNTSVMLYLSSHSRRPCMLFVKVYDILVNFLLSPNSLPFPSPSLSCASLQLCLDYACNTISLSKAISTSGPLCVIFWQYLVFLLQIRLKFVQREQSFVYSLVCHSFRFKEHIFLKYCELIFISANSLMCLCIKLMPQTQICQEIFLYISSAYWGEYEITNCDP